MIGRRKAAEEKGGRKIRERTGRGTG